MNNTLNAKLSKLVYAPVSDAEGGIINGGNFDRFILLVRRIYQTIDEQQDLTQVTLRLRCGQKQGLVTLDEATPQTDSATLRLQRWGVYSGIAKHVADCNDLSAAVQDITVKGAVEKSYYTETLDEMIVRFGLSEKAAAEPAVSAHPAENDVKTDDAEPSKKSIRSIIAYRGKSLSRIGTQAKTETYKSAPANHSLRVSRLNFGGYKQK